MPHLHIEAHRDIELATTVPFQSTTGAFPSNTGSFQSNTGAFNQAAPSVPIAFERAGGLPCMPRAGAFYTAEGEVRRRS